VVLFVLDAARADHFGLYGYPRDTTPAADAFAKEGTRYDLVISEAPFTVLAMTSLLTGGSPAVTGLVGRAGGIVPDELELLAESARDNGFTTLAYSENPYITATFGFTQGFQLFDDSFPGLTYLRTNELEPGFDPASRIAGLVEAGVAAEGPFFLYVHLLRPHNPYAPPTAFAGRFGSDRARRNEGHTRALVEMDRQAGDLDPERLARVISLYDENLAYADALFGDLLGALDARGLRDRTIVVLTSDHGEAFGEHGRMLHSSQLFDPMLHVPLIVRVPGEAPGIRTEPIQLADLGRGLLALFRGEPGAAASLTRLGVGREGPVRLYSWTDHKSHLAAVRTDRVKLVIDSRSLDAVAYYDLVADPREHHPIELDAEAEPLRASLTARVMAWSGTPIRMEPPESIDLETRRLLEALGYLEADSGSDSGPTQRSRSE
jgi:arylsulfatase